MCKPLKRVTNLQRSFSHKQRCRGKWTHQTSLIIFHPDLSNLYSQFFSCYWCSQVQPEINFYSFCFLITQILMPNIGISSFWRLILKFLSQYSHSPSSIFERRNFIELVRDDCSSWWVKIIIIIIITTIDSSVGVVSMEPIIVGFKMLNTNGNINLIPWKYFRSFLNLSARASVSAFWFMNYCPIIPQSRPFSSYMQLLSFHIFLRLPPVSFKWDANWR